MTRKNKAKINFSEADESIIFRFKGSDYTYVILGYPEWRAYIGDLEENNFITVQPEINLALRTIVFPDKNKSDEDEPEEIRTQREAFFNTIPGHLTELVSVFGDSHWEMIKALILYGNELELLIARNPALAYLALNLEKFNTSFSLYNNMAFIRSLISKKQKELLGYAFFPPTERIVKAFSKIEVSGLTVGDLFIFRDYLFTDTRLKDKILKLISHSKKLDGKFFSLLKFGPELLHLFSYKACFSIMESEKLDEIITAFSRIKKEAAILDPGTHEIDSMNDLERTVENLRIKAVKKREKMTVFPPPPLSGNEFITPIRTVQEQKAWALQQHNCIRNYIRNVKARRSYFYKVIYENEHATLELKIGRNIKMGDLLGTDNIKVSERLRSMVRGWFYIHSNGNEFIRYAR